VGLSSCGQNGSPDRAKSCGASKGLLDAAASKMPLRTLCQAVGRGPLRQGLVRSSRWHSYSSLAVGLEELSSSSSDSRSSVGEGEETVSDVLPATLSNALLAVEAIQAGPNLSLWK
jgi:hypothetical protein